MLDIRLDRTADGCCTLFVGSTLVFSDLRESEAESLIEALRRTRSEGSVLSSAEMARSTGSRAGDMQDRDPSRGSPVRRANGFTSP